MTSKNCAKCNKSHYEKYLISDDNSNDKYCVICYKKIFKAFILNNNFETIKQKLAKLDSSEFHHMANDVFPKLLNDKTKNRITNLDFITELSEYICETIKERNYGNYYLDDYAFVYYDKYVSYNLLERIPSHIKVKSTYLKQLLFENHQSLHTVLDKCLSLKPSINENVKLLLSYYRKKDKIIAKYLSTMPLDIVDMIIDYSD
jgi:hypothetical protein